jgi:thymidylate synthase
MNSFDEEYLRLLRLVLAKGRVKKNRTGVDTKGVFGAQARFDLSQGLPILTTKKIFAKGVIHELLWFISGNTNIRYLVENGVHIWDDWAFARYQKLKPREGGLMLVDPFLMTNQELRIQKGQIEPDENAALVEVLKSNIATRQTQFIDKIKRDVDFAAKWGNLGEGTYGSMWRTFPYYHELPSGEINFNQQLLGTVDQLKKIVTSLKTNPDDRRMIVTAWHPYWVDHCALPPCHCLFQFHTEELSFGERLDLYYRTTEPSKGSVSPSLEELKDIPTRRLNCQLYQRSCDLFLGVPFNILSYSLLTSMVAHCVNMVPGEFIHTYGDLHIYSNHMEQVKEQMRREPYAPAKLWLNPEVRDIFHFKYDDILIQDYQCHPTIKGEVAV